MKNKWGKQNGVTLTEVAIALAILTAIGLSFTFRRTNAEKKLDARSEDRATLLSAVMHVAQMGKLASNCQKQTPPGQVILDCSYASTLSSGGASKFRFRKTASEFVLEKSVDGLTYTTAVSYPNIREFALCDENDFLGNTCSIVDTSATWGINGRRAFYAGLPAADPRKSPLSRFFRYELSVDGPETGKLFKLSSAFFVRNPTNTLLVDYGFYGGQQ